MTEFAEVKAWGTLLEGGEVVAVRTLTDDEREALGWFERCVVVVELKLVSGGVVGLIPQRDPEGNGAGALLIASPEACTVLGGY